MRAYAGSYSPDGRWIVFRLEDHGQNALMRIRTDGTHLRTILPLSAFRPRLHRLGRAGPKHHEHGHGHAR